VGSFLGASAGSSADVLQQRALAVLVGPLGLSLVGFTLAALGTLFQLLLVLIVTFFLVRDVERISNLLRNLVPATYRDDVSDLAHRLRIMFAAYLRGQGLICLIIGAATGVVIFVLRLDYALALAVIAGLSAIVPFIGPFIGAVPAVAFALAVSPVKALIVAVAFVVIDNVVLNFVVPKVMGDAVRLHPVIVIVAFLAGYSAAGLVGMFVAIPVAATARIMFDFFRERVYGRAPVTP
jgi:predicted PurR-regulated permease PerM